MVSSPHFHHIGCLNFIISDVQPTNKEVETSSETEISCIISGITKQLNSVVWTKDGTDVTTLTEDNSYVVSAGTYGSNSQTTTLTVKAAVNTADSTYTCVITSNEWLVTNRQTSVALNVFGKFKRLPTLAKYQRTSNLTICIVIESDKHVYLLILIL